MFGLKSLLKIAYKFIVNDLIDYNEFILYYVMGFIFLSPYILRKSKSPMQAVCLQIKVII